jgi:multiple sugar transport system substrate-binding protein
VRRLVAVLAAVVTCAAVAGCTGSGSEPRSDASQGASPTPTQDPPLSVFVYGDKDKVAAYQKIADAFSASEGGAPVKLHVYEDAAHGADAAMTALTSDFAPDVFLVDQSYLPEFVDPPLVEPLDGPLEDRGLQFGDDYQRVALTAMSANSGLQCMPAEISPLVVYYNKRLVPRDELEQRGVRLPSGTGGWSWENFEATARAIAGVDRLGPIKGVSLPSTIELVAALVRSGGGDIVDDDVDPTRLDLESDTAVETIRTVATLARDPSVSLTTKQLDRKDPVQWFTEGRLGMFVGTRADLPTLRSAPGLRFDVAPLPGFGSGRSVSTINGWCVSKNGKHTDEAADFVAFAVGPRASRIAARSDVIVPTRLDTVNSNAFLDPGEQPRNAEVYGVGIRRSDPMPFAKGWPAVAQSTDIVLQKLFTDPFFNLDTRLERRLARLDAMSEAQLAPVE